MPKPLRFLKVLTDYHQRANIRANESYLKGGDMRKLVLVVVVLIMGVVFAGCQQASLTEAEVRNIVREEVTNQLATGQLKGMVGQEVTKQLANVGDVVRGEVIKQMAGVNDIVKQQASSQLASINNLVGNEVTRQLANVENLTLSTLNIKNKDGKIVAEFAGGAMGGYLNFINLDGDRVVFLSDSGLTIRHEGHFVAAFGTMEFPSGAICGNLDLFSTNGTRVASLGCSRYDNGMLDLYTSDGQPIASIYGGEHGDGDIFLYNRYGEIVASMGADSKSNGVIGLNNKNSRSFTFLAP
jgi:hypothetical protein